MKERTISEHPVVVRIIDDKGKVETKQAIFLNVLEGVSATFLCDIYLWLNSRPPQVTERWKDLLAFIYFRGGDNFPKFYTMRAKGYDRDIHLVNVDLTE